MFDIFKGHSMLTLFATILIIFFGIYYMPIDSYATNAPIKMALMVTSIIILFLYTFKASKALIIGIIYLIYQYIVASFHPESFRWSTYIYSILLVLTFVSFYNLIFIERVFKIDHFIKICKWFMMLYFVVCIIQQVLTILGISYFPLFNMMTNLNRGLGCQSLSMEPSTFARFMLVFYYAYVKCCEYKRNEGPFTLRELFSGEHKWVTIRFLWMMLTMGSATAYACIVLFSLYFVRWHNWYYVIPSLLICYTFAHSLEIEQFERTSNAISATVSLDKENLKETDASASVRINPGINTFNADYTKFETWFGYGIDAGNMDKANRTVFHDYGLVLYIISYIMNFCCGYTFWSIGTIFLLAGVGGGAGSNIQYAWELMMVMTCVKYFYENRYNPEIYEDETGDIENQEGEYSQEQTAS